ncbi:unnamed protein product [Didymodactylos carnosus]|uniref:Uncharacterized protein n=1 Tax=Didymodactylos carnosus TaxID=1234261 RepID=A0A814V921_9BILA|nr:unnamed protein product [Didymodactylos carnosus]CAF1185883.1 unnamed protein product [Didymodactylos carnosus]CAF3765647.1 unnamed protein product [Didymodactylos carnosus]CAF3950106.1 unnamed protein product [Didymodactylos carnosus]
MKWSCLPFPVSIITGGSKLSLALEIIKQLLNKITNAASNSCDDEHQIEMYVFDEKRLQSFIIDLCNDKEANTIANIEKLHKVVYSPSSVGSDIYDAIDEPLEYLASQAISKYSPYCFTDGRDNSSHQVIKERLSNIKFNQFNFIRCGSAENESPLLARDADACLHLKDTKQVEGKRHKNFSKQQ